PREHLDCVVAAHAHVLPLRRRAREEQSANPRRVDLDAEEVLLRVLSSECGEVFPVSESDLDDSTCLAPEHLVEIEELRIELEPKARPQLIEGAPLRIGQAAPSDDEGTDGAWMLDGHGRADDYAPPGGCGKGLARGPVRPDEAAAGGRARRGSRTTRCSGAQPP